MLKAICTRLYQGSHNQIDTDNPQERLLSMNTHYDKTISDRVGNYLAGFTDGEGSFNVSLTKRSDYNAGNGYKLTLSFNVSQKDRTVLALFKRYLKCGRLQTRSDGVTYYKVENPKALKENVIPFFERFSFLSQQKINNFSIFKVKLLGLWWLINTQPKKPPRAC